MIKSTVGLNFIPRVVQKGKPVRWIIQAGENIIEFTPAQEGKITYTCRMGMLQGYVKVVDDLNNIDLRKIKKEIEAYRPGGGVGCCGK